MFSKNLRVNEITLINQVSCLKLKMPNGNWDNLISWDSLDSLDSFINGAITKYLNIVLENGTFIFFVNKYISDVIHCL